MRTSNVLNLRSHKLFTAAMAVGLCLPAVAGTVDVDVSNTEDPTISWTIDPYAFAPDFPEYPTVIYPGTKATATGTITDDTTEEAPTVKTSDAEPDTYTLSRASVYYTAPTEPAGPYNNYSSTDLLRFDLGPGPVAPGYTQILQSTAYGPTSSYGWGDTSRVASRDRGTADPLTRDFCLPSGTPFYADLENGLYEVTITGGDATAKSQFSVRAEGAQQLWRVDAPAGKTRTDSFRVHITDGRLRLEFFGSLCPVDAIVIRRVTEAEARQTTTIYLAGDSTCATYAPESVLVGWGAALKNHFTDKVRVANYAFPGASSKSFVESLTLDGIVRAVRPGDYVFVSFAINDSADDTSNRKTRAESTFKAYMRVFVDAARSKGAIPVFVTSQTKNSHDLWGRYVNAVQGYPQAQRQLGAELNVPVIDLNRKSIDYFTAIGPTAAAQCFNDPDHIHFKAFGADRLARLVSQGVVELGFPIAAHVNADRPETAVFTQ